MIWHTGIEKVNFVKWKAGKEMWKRNYIELLSEMHDAYFRDNIEWANDLAKSALSRIDTQNLSECKGIITVFQHAVDNKQYDIAVNEIIKIGWDFDRPFEDGSTLLHYAVDKALSRYQAYKDDKRELFKQIAMTGAKFDVQDKSGCNALTYLMTGCYRGNNGEFSEDCIRDIAEYSDVKAFSQKDDKGLSALHYALLTDNKYVLEIAAKKGCDFNIQAGSGETPLHLAMSMRDIKSIKFLINHGASTLITDNKKRNVLHWFMLRPDTSRRRIIKREHRNEMELKSSFTQFEQEVLDVLDKHLLIIQEDEEGHTPFYYIDEKEECTLADWFLKNEAYKVMTDVQKEDIKKRFENVSEEYNNFGRNMYMKMKLMESDGIDVSSLHDFDFWCESAVQVIDSRDMFIESLFKESGYYIEQAIKKIDDIRFEEEKVFDIIRVALNIRLKHTEILGTLRDMGVNFNKLQDDEGVSVLWKIVSGGYGWETMEPELYLPALMENGVDIYEHNNKEQSIFWEFVSKYAYELKDSISVSVLGKTQVEEKSNLTRLVDFFPAEEFTHKDFQGNMISLVAAGASKCELMQALIKRGIDINACGEDEFGGMTALHIACYRSYPQMVRMIIDAGADLEAVDNEGHSAAQYAAFSIYGFSSHSGYSGQKWESRDWFKNYDDSNHNHDIELLYADRKEIWDMLPDIDVPDNNGVTPLLELSKSDKGVELCLDYMIGRGADINAVDREGNTPIMVYIRYSRYDDELVKYIKSGADVNHQNNEGNTPLLLAMKKNSFKFVKILIAAGADINIKNNKGITALDYAIEHEMTKYIQLLDN